MRSCYYCYDCGWSRYCVLRTMMIKKSFDAVVVAVEYGGWYLMMMLELC